MVKNGRPHFGILLKLDLFWLFWQLNVKKSQISVVTKKAARMKDASLLDNITNFFIFQVQCTFKFDPKFKRLNKIKALD